MELVGINFSGMEASGNGNIWPAVYDQDYTSPTTALMDYYIAKGATAMRLPILWERAVGNSSTPWPGSLNDTYLQYVDQTVSYWTGQGAYLLLDVHNYGQFNGADVSATGPSPNAGDLASLWAALAARYADNQNVIFGIMNEPHDQSAADWLSIANASAAAIRAAGAQNWINYQGTGWTNALNWMSMNADLFVPANLTDPLNRYLIEIHLYFDPAGSGTSPAEPAAAAGVDVIAPITQWAQQNGLQLWMGENGFAGDSENAACATGMLDSMVQNGEVWKGYTYWAGGWINAWTDIDPTGTTDSAQMTTLLPYLPGVGSL